MPGGAGGEAFVSRPNVIVVAALAVLTLTAWAWVLAGAGMDMDMAGMSVTDMATLSPPWTLSYAVLMVFMWITMMIAMMTPSATPAALLYATLSRRQREKGLASAGPAPFMAGYLAVWSAFSLAATLAQWGLERLGLVGMAMSSGAALSGALCLAAGIYQFANFKNACLRHCQNPLFYFAEHWRPGAAGAFRMGVAHGGFCLGCCWVLMALLFVGGVMNPLWIAGIAVYVALEKLAPRRLRLSRAAGLALIAAGAVILAGVFA